MKRQVSEAQYATNKPKLRDVACVRFIRRSSKIFWKKSHNDTEFHSSKFLQKKALKSLCQSFLRKYKPRGITTAKKENIIKVIFPHLNENRKQFWLDLPQNDFSKDLSVERDPREEEKQE